MKTEFKGTKGEWKVAYSGLEFNIEGCKVKDINAKLIAASPDILEALQHGLRLANSLPNKESIAVRMFIKAAEKALEKALT